MLTVVILKTEAEAMIINGRGRTGWHQAALRTTLDTSNYTGCISRNKALIVMLLMWNRLIVEVVVPIIHT